MTPNENWLLYLAKISALRIINRDVRGQFEAANVLPYCLAVKQAKTVQAVNKVLARVAELPQ